MQLRGMDRGLGPCVVGGARARPALGPAQSFTIPTACTDAAQCAAFCRSVVEEGRTDSDFLQLAAYQLGPERPMDLPPANMSMPAPVDPKNVYAGTGAGMFSPAVAGHLYRVYSPNLITGKVDVIDPETFKVIESLDRHSEPAAYRAVLGSADALGVGRHQLPRRPRRRHADRPEDRQARQGDRRARFLQPLFHPRRPSSAIMVAEAMRRLEFRDPQSMALQGYIATPKVPGYQPRGLFPRRLLRDLHLRIRQCARQDRSRPPHARRACCRYRRAACRRTSAIAPDGSAFFVADLLKDGVVVDRRRLFQGGRLHSHRRRRTRALSQPRRNQALRLQSRHPQYRGSRGRARAPSRCSISPHAKSSPTGRSPAAAARTWET